MTAAKVVSLPEPAVVGIAINKVNFFLIFNKPASGLNDGSNLYHGEVVVFPPIAPNKTLSLFLAIFKASSLNGTP